MAYGFSPFLSCAVLIILTSACASFYQDSASTPHLIHAEVIPVEVEDNEPLLYASLFCHPYQFGLKAIPNLMRSLFFLPFPIDGDFREDRRRVFPEKVILEVAPLIKKTFQEVKSYQKVQFQVRTPAGLTAGDTFIWNGALHWRFTLIQDIPPFETFPNVYRFEGDTKVPRNWIIIPQQGQQYYASEVLLEIQKAKKNWVVFNLEPTTERETNQQPEGGHHFEPDRTENKTLVQRLQFLKELKDEDLISVADFQSQVRILMNETNTTRANPKERLLFLKDLRENNVISEKEYKEKVQDILEAL